LSSIRCSGDAGRQAGVGRFTRFLLACLAAALGATAPAGPAQAALNAAGAVNPATGYPDWYADGGELRLQLCLDGPPFCLASKADLKAPDGEAFWFQAESTLDIGTGSARLVLAHEAAFLNTDRISFGRMRIVVRSARPDTTYEFAHPYGNATVTTDGLGNGRFNSDVGCGGAPCDWNAALGTDVSPQFLRWNPAVPPAAPAGYIGDSVTPHPVTGGSVRNTFGVSGGGVSATTDLFTVQGKLAGDPFPVFKGPSETAFGSTMLGLPVVKAITVQSFGVPDAAGRSDLKIGAVGVSGSNPAAFTIVGDACSNRVLPSGAGCTVNVQFTPGAPGAASATLDIPDNAANLRTEVALSGEGTAPPVTPTAAALAAARAPGRLAIARLRTTHRLSRARVLRRGLRLSMRVPQGTEILKIAVHRVRRGRAEARNVWVGFRVVSRAGLLRVRLDSRTLRRRLKAGLYQINVTPGVSRRELGRTTTTRIRITRR